MTQATQRITYATMAADPNLHVEFDAAIERVKSTLGRTYPMYINGEAVTAAEQFEDRSPVDTRILLGRFQQGGREHVQRAIDAARAAAPGWSATPWKERVRMLKKLCDTIRKHQYDLSALMIYEVGKNRLECLGDVVETADLIEYYCDEFERNNGYLKPMDTLGPNENNYSVLRPYGVFAVISPFNFPFALAGGPAGAAMVAGNTVVFKPASDTALMGVKLAEMVRGSGHPEGSVQLRHRSGAHRRAGDDRQQGHRRHRLHRLDGGGDEAAPRQRRTANSAPGDHRDGGEEPCDHHQQGGSRESERRRLPVGLRRAGAEVLRLLADLRLEGSPAEVRRPARREDEEDQDRQSAREGRLDGPGRQRRGVEDVRRGSRAWRRTTAAGSSPAATGS